MEPAPTSGVEAIEYWLSLGLNLDELVGLDADDARRRIEALGGHAQMITPDVKVVTADFGSLRIRLRVDEDGRVFRATAG